MCGRVEDLSDFLDVIECEPFALSAVHPPGLNIEQMDIAAECSGRHA
jgi:hypothetical protein